MTTNMRIREDDESTTMEMRIREDDGDEDIQTIRDSLQIFLSYSRDGDEIFVQQASHL